MEGADADPAPAVDLAAPPATATGQAAITAFHESLHLSVPTHDTPAAALIQKPNRPLDVVAKEGDKKMRIRSIKRVDCQEVGKDKFDEKVSEFLDHVGQLNIISINTINYSTIDMATRTLVQDYGVMIVFKG